MSFGRRSSAPLRNASERELTMTTNRVVRADQYQRRREQLAAGAVRIASYKLADRIVCAVDNVDPAAQLARADGATRVEAEARALEKAAELLRRTRVHAPA
jgi:hypothetical protein